MFRILSLLLGLFAAYPLAAQTAWEVDPDFGKKSREDLSGAACTPDRCIAINDETHYVQEFTLKKNRVKPGERIRLLDKGEEIDAEAIAATGNTFYIAGSHGLTRKKAKLNRSSFALFRLKGDDIRSTDRLRTAIRDIPALRAYAEKPLTQNGVNIEGLAAKGDRLFFGFRGPSVKGHAFVLEASAKALFSDAKLTPILHTIRLEDRIGIRDMVAVPDGILLLTGPVNTLPRRFAVRLWSPADDKITTLAQVPLAGKDKPEGLLILSENDETYQALILYDGPRNGAPIEMPLPKP